MNSGDYYNQGFEPQQQKGQYPNNCRIFLGNLASEKTSRAELFDIFGKYGNIVEDIVLRRSFGFVQYDNPQSAIAAIQGENGRIIGGIKVDISLADNREPKQKRKDFVDKPRFGNKDFQGNNFVQGQQRGNQFGYKDNKFSNQDSDKRGRGNYGDNSGNKRGRSPPRSQSNSSNKRGRSRSPVRNTTTSSNINNNNNQRSGTNAIPPLIQIIYLSPAQKDYAKNLEKLFKAQIGLRTDSFFINNETVPQILTSAEDRGIKYVAFVNPNNESTGCLSLNLLQKSGKYKAFNDITYFAAIDITAKEEKVELHGQFALYQQQYQQKRLQQQQQQPRFGGVGGVGGVGAGMGVGNVGVGGLGVNNVGIQGMGSSVGMGGVPVAGYAQGQVPLNTLPYNNNVAAPVPQQNVYGAPAPAQQSYDSGVGYSQTSNNWANPSFNATSAAGTGAVRPGGYSARPQGQEQQQQQYSNQSGYYPAATTATPGTTTTPTQYPQGPPTGAPGSTSGAAAAPGAPVSDLSSSISSILATGDTSGLLNLLNILQKTTASVPANATAPVQAPIQSQAYYSGSAPQTVPLSQPQAQQQPQQAIYQAQSQLQPQSQMQTQSSQLQQAQQVLQQTQQMLQQSQNRGGIVPSYSPIKGKQMPPAYGSGTQQPNQQYQQSYQPQTQTQPQYQQQLTQQPQYQPQTQAQTQYQPQSQLTQQQLPQQSQSYTNVYKPQPTSSNAVYTPNYPNYQ
eukprot:TRINITY_DN9231_c0_g1_i1.p1 TRINITY_DN9231_c0_g1~~TRINITY_DN9231_c0_g1_i1.p1  ORF type:complete len:731 (-),score=133.63 TRINITY_DN9231_c0_g1_i1:119-2311(-)